MDFRFRELSNTLISTVSENVKDKDIGVAFSGGLDSGLVAAIAKSSASSVTLYTCGTSKAYDVVMAEDLSSKLDLPWVHVKISKSDIEKRIRDFITATGISDPFTISYELQLFSVCSEAKEKLIMTGQGADEYFMGCAKYVNQKPEDFLVLKDEGVERLMKVSVPCELDIAKHFGKKLFYPYLEKDVVNAVGSIDPEILIPQDMDSRKSVLREIAVELGFPYIAERKKKSSQYGSGTTDLIRGIAKTKGMMYNEYIASVYDDVMLGKETMHRGAIINARIDPVIKAKAEAVLRENNLTPSDAIDMLYHKLIAEGISFLSDKKPTEKEDY